MGYQTGRPPPEEAFTGSVHLIAEQASVPRQSSACLSFAIWVFTAGMPQALHAYLDVTIFSIAKKTLPTSVKFKSFGNKPWHQALG